MPVEERAEEQSEGRPEVRPEALPEEQEQPAVSGLSRHREPAAGRCRCLGTVLSQSLRSLLIKSVKTVF